MKELDQLWSFIVIRTHGLSFLRPERSWRPIVTVAIDEHEHHEVLLGNDGQNPNLRAPFHLRDVHAGSKVDIKIWHRSQSKKKAKKRNLVATASHSLGDLVKGHETVPSVFFPPVIDSPYSIDAPPITSEVEIRLNCQLSQKRGTASKGKPQNGAYVVVKVNPPGSFKTSLTSAVEDEPDSPLETGFRTPPSPTSDRTVSDSESDDGMPPVEQNTTRIRGYLSESDSDTLNNEDGSACVDDEENTGIDNDDCEDEKRASHPVVLESMYWLFPSLLPSYTEKIEVDSSPPFLERVFSHFTMYKELKNATLDSHFEAVFARLQLEWTYVGGLLIALAAVDTAVFSMSSGPGSLFNVDKFATSAVAASSIASGVGISCDAWFLLRYNWADVHTFRIRARDIYGSYFFFSLSARLPSFSMLLSALSLMAFLGRVAFNSWPEAVVIICIMFGVIMSLQFLVFGAHWCVRRVVDGSRMVYRASTRTFRSNPDAPPPPPYE